MIARLSLAAALLLGAVGTNPAQAQSAGDNSGFAFCPDRPAEPEILQSIDMREAHKRILAQRMYTTNALQAVADAGDCSCETRFPSWDATVDEYLEKYAGLDDRWQILEITSDYRRKTNELRKAVRQICIDQGNW